MRVVAKSVTYLKELRPLLGEDDVYVSDAGIVLFLIEGEHEGDGLLYQLTIKRDDLGEVATTARHLANIIGVLSLHLKPQGGQKGLSLIQPRLNTDFSTFLNGDTLLKNIGTRVLLHMLQICKGLSVGIFVFLSYRNEGQVVEFAVIGFEDIGPIGVLVHMGQPLFTS